MKKAERERLVVEELEGRWLLSGVWEGVDVDGDAVVVKLSGPGWLEVESTPDGLGEWIDTIAVYDTTRSSALSVKARQDGGDGFVDVGFIDATGETLKQINVDGYLYGLTSGSLKKLAAFGTAPSDEGVWGWAIDGSLGELRIDSHLQDVEVRVRFDVNKAVIGGDLARASMLIDGSLRNLQVKGDAVDSKISVLGRIDSVKINGWLENSTVETDDGLNKLFVGGDILDSDIYAAGWINRIVTDGNIQNTVIETPGYINVIDAWEWVADTDIIAGPDGIGTIYAWNLSNVNIETDGQFDQLYLDAYARNEYWGDLEIPTETGWFWPVYDAEYIDSVYDYGYYDYYYTADYWDVYYDGTWYETYYWDTYGYLYYN
jgi:hypothetical protein